MHIIIKICKIFDHVKFMYKYFLTYTVILRDVHPSVLFEVKLKTALVV